MASTTAFTPSPVTSSTSFHPVTGPGDIGGYPFTTSQRPSIAVNSASASPTGKLVNRKKIHNVLALSRPATVFNSVMLSFPVVGVVNDKLRTVHARRSSGSASYGTSCASPMLSGVRHRDGNSGIVQVGVHVRRAATAGR
ncbi:uncharacterized protein AMSG_01903 [Thecamonas trahens ATCC 50062]|uniref:Uncharacterized protein n=1 Tax=Thecamonas trahens ATCC 50062 TaxID=461836 RepID=A0A0L0DTI4_THETB|nr:hypothetical protein AMSG_01903 [Thecamonas trahens ATCC 50062]KNC55634.1 hypothetical protein AMSG_01903 [Thecamonas trahens ATCC 50062]|eukprot:XP_013761404.1 hypothetical protein AMSG_01903 [Thecamonas trahens ATCC 50062]